MSLRITKKQAFELLVIVMLCQNTLFDLFRVVISRLPYIGVFSDFFFPVIYMILAILSFSWRRIKWIRIGDLALIMYFAAAIGVSALIYPINAPFIRDRMFVSILPCLPFFLIGLCMTFDESFLEKTSDFCCVAIILQSAYLVYFFASGKSLSGDDMSASYNLLPNLMIVVSCAFYCRKKRYILFSVWGALYIIAMGTRGPIVILAIYVLICLWQRSRLHLSGRIAITISIVVLIFLFSRTEMYTNLLIILRRGFRKYGLSSRAIDYLLRGQLLSDSSGRDTIYLELLGLLKERPLLGYGVFGEWQFVNFSAHNIFLETIFQYGWIVGSVMIVAYTATVILSFQRSSNPIAKRLIILWGCFTFVRGVFGGELMSFYVFFLLGISLKEYRAACTENVEVNNGA